MRTSIDHGPVDAALRVTFDRPGEQLVAARAALVARDGAVDARVARADVESSRREPTHTSTTFTATAPGQSLWLAPPCDGAIEVVALLPGAELYLDARAWLASTPGVALDATWHGARSFYDDPRAAAGRVRGAMPLLRAWGEGQVWFGAYGGFHLLDVGAPHPAMVCDTAHVVAFTHGLEHTVRAAPALSGPAAPARLVELKGHGRVWLQTRRPASLAAFLHPFRGVGGARARD